MEQSGRPLRFPTFEEIVETNLRHLALAGQPALSQNNLREPGSLRWVLEAVQSPLFGVDWFPTLAEKAARLAWAITGGHIFWDGNRRTGMSVLLVFVRMNGYRLAVTSDEIVAVALRIAQAHAGGRYTHGQFVQWVRERMIPL